MTGNKGAASGGSDCIKSIPFQEEMECSVRTKRRRIAAKVAEHFRQVSQECEFDQSLGFQSGHDDFTENEDFVYHECAQSVDSAVDEPTDIFYDALDTLRNSLKQMNVQNQIQIQIHQMTVVDLESGLQSTMFHRLHFLLC